ncbi:MAG: hypothetical protein HYU66_05385 [Armatimonadetes bacterium]|nr:hypothetical protein [Armatimonadota bacterium]
MTHRPALEPPIAGGTYRPGPELKPQPVGAPPGQRPLRSRHPGREVVLCELPTFLGCTEPEIEAVLGTPSDKIQTEGVVGDRRRNNYCLPAAGKVFLSFRERRCDRAELYFELVYPGTMEDALRAGGIGLAALRDRDDHGTWVSWKGSPCGVPCKQVWVLISPERHHVTGVCVKAPSDAAR